MKYSNKNIFYTTKYMAEITTLDLFVKWFNLNSQKK